jgi:hypothetical protein
VKSVRPLVVQLDLADLEVLVPSLSINSTCHICYQVIPYIAALMVSQLHESRDLLTEYTILLQFLVIFNTWSVEGITRALVILAY